jgi:hypothetical protein
MPDGENLRDSKQNSFINQTVNSIQELLSMISNVIIKVERTGLITVPERLQVLSGQFPKSGAYFLL